MRTCALLAASGQACTGYNILLAGLLFGGHCRVHLPAPRRRAPLRRLLPAPTPPPAAPLELSLVLCDDAHIRELNREWRDIDAPTDVLSFELEDDEDETGCKPEVGGADCAGCSGASARCWGR